MLVQMQCPQCGATLDFDQSKDFMFCQFCGHKVANIAQKVEIQQTINQNINQNVNVAGTVVHKTDKSREPNLIISFASSVPNIGMVTRIVDTNQKNTYLNGQTMTFHISQGPHTVVLKIGKKNYNRTIYIPDDNEPVRINAGFSKRAFINIDQPEYTVASDPSIASSSVPAPQVTRNVAPRLPASLWSILSFVFSFTFFGSPIGLGLGIYDLFFKKETDKAHGLAIAGVVIGFLMSLLLVSSIFSK